MEATDFYGFQDVALSEVVLPDRMPHYKSYVDNPYLITQLAFLDTSVLVMLISLLFYALLAVIIMMWVIMNPQPKHKVSFGCELFN